MPGDAFDALPFWNWLPWAFGGWLLIMFILVFVGIAAGWMVAAMRKGPEAATSATLRAIRDIAGDLAQISPRRILALTRLTVKESIRRRVVVVFAVFILIVLFAGWFLDPGSSDPGRQYIGFVLDMTRYLVLIMALLLSAVSLPNDIRKRTLHTVVTKPARRSEIVLGRMLGFIVVGTVLLAVMGPISYGFVVRGLSHTHQLLPADLEMAEQKWNSMTGKDAPREPLVLRTTMDHGHQHMVKIDPRWRIAQEGKQAAETSQGGRVKTEVGGGHWHVFSYEVEQQADRSAPPRIKYSIGPAQDMLVARVPIFGTLQFKDRAGKDKEKGINVGFEWEYRGYIEGGTACAAIWTFENISERDFPQGLPVEMTIEIFRSHKGVVSRGVRGSLWVQNPKDQQWICAVDEFEAKEYVTDVHFIPRQLRTSDGRYVDLFKDVVDRGRLAIRLVCEDVGQYLGAAPHDLYLRARDVPFAWNFVKGYLGIWLQMALIVGFGVMFSTFLSAPISLLASMGVLVAGTFYEFVQKLATHQVWGGGPLEQGYRMLHQQNQIVELPSELRFEVTQMIDRVLEFMLGLLARLLPDFAKFSFPDDQGHFCVATGFDISTEMVLKGLAGTLGFLIPLLVAGYCFLKIREVAR
jgi:hypothetical protein